MSWPRADEYGTGQLDDGRAIHGPESGAALLLGPRCLSILSHRRPSASVSASDSATSPHHSMSTSSPEDAPPSDPSTVATAGAGSAHEPLACVNCRSRKLKCEMRRPEPGRRGILSVKSPAADCALVPCFPGDRQKPICARCAKAGGECLYPESRRKPAFKRRNVRELEERLGMPV